MDNLKLPLAFFLWLTKPQKIPEQKSSHAKYANAADMINKTQEEFKCTLCNDS